MDNDAPFRFQPPPQADVPQSVSSTKSSQAGVTPSSRSSESTSNSNQSHRMSLYSIRPHPGTLMEPRQFHEETPAPPRPYIHPPPLAPYVMEEQRVRPPPVHAWGTVPDPGLQRYHQSNAPPYLPGPVHSPPKGNRWKELVHRDHPLSTVPLPLFEPARPTHSAPVTSSSQRHVVHPPPHTAGARITLPPLSAALSSSSMDRTWSRASEQSIPMTRTYSQSQEGSMPSQSRPSSHGSSGRGGIDPNHSGGSGSLAPHGDQELPLDSKKKRHRALFTSVQQEHLKKLWKQNKFPAVAEREQLGKAIGLNHRQVQVWFQNQRQKMRKEINTTGIPNDADPRDYNDLDKSPRSRRMSLEAAVSRRPSVEASSKPVDKISPWIATLPDDSQPHRPGMMHEQHSAPWRPRDLSGNPVTGSVRPSHRHLPHNDHPYHSRPTSSNTTTWMVPRGTGHRSSGPPSPLSYHGLSPPPDHMTSPTRPTFTATRERERRRPPPVSMMPRPDAEGESYKSSVDSTFGDVSSRYPSPADTFIPCTSPRRRSTSLEGMRPRRTPSPTVQPGKRTRTNTNTSSQLPPSLAALALSGPVDAYVSSRAEPNPARRLPSLSLSSTTQDHHNGLPTSAPTLPPPRGWAQERERPNTGYHPHPPHTADPTNHFPRHHPQAPQAQSDLKGPGTRFYQYSPDLYRR